MARSAQYISFRGSLDLAVTRFNGKRAPAKPGVDHVQAEAYSHEVISAGFWPGNGGYGRAAFYAYAAPIPDGLQNTVLKGKGGFNLKMGEFLLDYAAARDSDDPADTVLEFGEESYSAAADLAKWDRSSLDRQDEVAGAMQLRDALSSSRRLLGRMGTLEPFSDGVFAITITIMVLDLRGAVRAVA